MYACQPLANSKRSWLCCGNDLCGSRVRRPVCNSAAFACTENTLYVGIARRCKTPRMTADSEAALGPATCLCMFNRRRLFKSLPVSFKLVLFCFASCFVLLVWEGRGVLLVIEATMATPLLFRPKLVRSPRSTETWPWVSWIRLISESTSSNSGTSKLTLKEVVFFLRLGSTGERGTLREAGLPGSNAVQSPCVGSHWSFEPVRNRLIGLGMNQFRG